MPFQDQRANVSQNVNNYAVTDNPAFKVSVKSLATSLEQSNRREPSKENKPGVVKLKMGDLITGEKPNSSKVVQGKIVQIEKNEIIVVDKSGERIKMDPNTCKKVEKESSGESGRIPFTSENKILSFNEFLKLDS